MKNEFFDWIIGIEEDEPLPVEIKYVCFILNKKNGMNELMYFGSEVQQEYLINFSYTPLEGQFFFSEEFFDIENPEEVVLGWVKEFLDSKFSKFLVGKNVLVGHLYLKPIFSCKFEGGI